MSVDTVVKLGGSLLADIKCLDAVLEAVATARGQRVLVVPGGGPFADVVRDVHHRLRLPEDAAHWMAVLAMDQYAHVLAARLEESVLVTEANEISNAFGAGRVPVLAPSRWLRDADPLPHSWDVTSDSIAAWFAGVLRAKRLVLVKPGGLRDVRPLEPVVDAYFARALHSHVTPVVVPADHLDLLRSTLAAGS